MIDILDISDQLKTPPHAADALENGAILRLQNPAFTLTPAERALIATGAVTSATKNISHNPADDKLKGTALAAPSRETLKCLMSRYATFARDLVQAIAPSYQHGLKTGRTSFRPCEIAARTTSWRKDDRRLHIDAFPSTPTSGARILRIFLNADQAGTARHWRVGPDFESFAKTFLPKIQNLPPGAATLLALTGITKTRRTGYDQTMLGLHDAAKRDTAWQAAAPACDISFLPGQAWLVFTDQTPHAALAGRNALEQSFYVAPDVLLSPQRAPLAVLSRLTGSDLSKPLI